MADIAAQKGDREDDDLAALHRASEVRNLGKVLTSLQPAAEVSEEGLMLLGVLDTLSQKQWQKVMVTVPGLLDWWKVMDARRRG